jgi:hypothetical protein
MKDACELATNKTQTDVNMSVRNVLVVAIAAWNSIWETITSVMVKQSTTEKICWLKRTIFLAEGPAGYSMPLLIFLQLEKPC